MGRVDAAKIGWPKWVSSGEHAGDQESAEGARRSAREVLVRPIDRALALPVSVSESGKIFDRQVGEIEGGVASARVASAHPG